MIKRVVLEAASKEHLETAYEEFKKHYEVVKVIDAQLYRNPAGISEGFMVYQRTIFYTIPGKVSYEEEIKM